MPANDHPATFADLGLRPEILDTLATLGYEEPTPVQREAIPPLLEGRDLLGRAPTGTGKTAAFALPILHRLAAVPRGRAPEALVLVPTRELAVQVAEATHRYGHGLGARVLPIYGGQSIVLQLRTLERGVDVVVATPGRALDHLARRTLDLSGIRTLVLDEADEMLDMGFADDLEAILQALPEERQTMLFSATIPARIEHMVRDYLHDPVRVRIQRERPEAGEAPALRQSAYLVQRQHKPAALGRVLDVEAPESALIFCRTRLEVDELAETLSGRGYRAEALHGGMSQQQRDRVMGRLRSGAADLIVATDVAARGLDIGPLTHVVNYDVPPSPEAYIHRVGRVGRAGRAGVAITLVQPREHHMLKAIERAIKQPITVEQVPTVADLRARQFELTRAALEETLIEANLDRYRAVLEPLTDEFELMDIALAAIKLAHEAGGAETDEVEIPEVRPPAPARARDRPGESDRGPRRAERGKRSAPSRREGLTRIFIGAGRIAGVRPQDVVGAITGESEVTGREIGAIEIADQFTLVEVPEAAVDAVIAALRGTTLKGRRPTVRRERF